MRRLDETARQGNRPMVFKFTLTPIILDPNYSDPNYSTVHLLDKAYESGKKLSAKQMKALSKRLVANTDLPKWDLVIAPTYG